MASLVQRDGSPFWYIQKKQGTKWVRQRTQYRIASTAETRKAQHLASQVARTEKAQRGSVAEMTWDQWVEPYFRVRYETRPKTLERFINAWTSVRLFLREQQIHIPSEVRREDCLKYVSWRTDGRKAGTYAAGRNTALFEIKLLGLVLGEAMTRGWIVVNPGRGLGLPRSPAKLKPEISLAEEEKIRTALKSEPRWMEVCFNLAMATGCRLAETSVPWSDVHLDRCQITFTQKGNRTHTTLLPDWIIPLLEVEKQLGAPRTVCLPRGPSKWWCNVFRKIGLGHISFHSTRVTVVSRLARAGITERLSMRYVGHASATVHRIYARLAPGDLDACAKALCVGATQARSVGSEVHSARDNCAAGSERLDGADGSVIQH